MSELPADALCEPIYSVDAVRAIDKAAIDGAGIPGYTLMTRAASAACEFALERFPGARRWQVVCGSGNNGGDGYVLAKLARERGVDADVVALAPADALRGDALTAYRDFVGAGGSVETWSGALAADAELLVDALLGSGLERDVGGDYAAAVAALNGHAAPKLALDIPTGVHGDSGAVMGVAVRAAATMTFVGLKAGLFLQAGPSCCGHLGFAGLGIPAACRDGIAARFRRVTPHARRALLPPRPRDAHKADFGHLVIVGGGPGMPGAALLAGAAALRCGAGLVSVVAHPSQVAAVVGQRPELMCHGAREPADVAPLLERADVVAIGPGLGRDAWAQALFDAVLGLDAPLVLDADALNMLALAPRTRERWILTPHPGEAGRLLGSSAGAVQADRGAALGELAHRYGGTPVLKGAGTLIGSRKGPPWLCTAGNPGMASPGMGDVLTGVVAALVAQGLDAEDAAVLGAELHARAGDAAARRGQRGLLAMDVVEELRAWANP